MKLHAVLAFAVLGLSFAPTPVGAQEVPNLAAPEVPEGAWAAQYQGVAYSIADGVVKRLDGQKPDTDAAAAVAKAQRVHELVAANQAFVERLAERENAQSQLSEQLVQADSAIAELEGLSQTLGVASAEGTIGDLLGELPARPVDLVTDAGLVRGALSQVQDASSRVEEASLVARGAIYAFDYSHAVEDKEFVLAAFRDAIPAYEGAAAQADLVVGRAERLAASAESVAAALEARSLDLLGLFGPDAAPSGIEDAIAQIQAVAGASQAYADSLRSDAAFMQGVATESTDGIVPIEWVVGGGAGLAGAGLGSLWWLRRRAGLP